MLHDSPQLLVCVHTGKSMDSAKFYSNLTSFADFDEVTNQEKFRTLPNDWLIVVADISNSTDAVSAGELKAANIIGVSVITAIRNAAALIVKATDESQSQITETYGLVIRKLASIYGQDEKCRPAPSGGLWMTYNRQK